MLRGANNKCYGCITPDHFINECSNNNQDSFDSSNNDNWVKNLHAQPDINEYKINSRPVSNYFMTNPFPNYWSKGFN